MKNWKRLSGMIAATFTPFDERGEVNLQAIDAYADWIATSPIRGVFVCGTTGEYASLTLSERKAILEKWVEAAGKRFIVIAHVGSNCQKDAVELSRHAEASGAYGIASIAPSFFKPSSVSDLVDFFAPMAAAAPNLPFYYYNMPAMTGVALPVEKFLEEGKKKIPNLAGIKFTHNNLMEMNVCLNYDGGAFEILHGYDETLMTGLSLGAVAGVGSTYNYIPRVYDGIFKAMQESDLEKARRFQLQSVRIVEVIIKYGGGVRGGKAIMNHIGVPCGDCRLPISPFTEAEKQALSGDLDEVGFVEMQEEATLMQMSHL